MDERVCVIPTKLMNEALCLSQSAFSNFVLYHINIITLQGKYLNYALKEQNASTNQPIKTR